MPFQYSSGDPFLQQQAVCETITFLEDAPLVAEPHTIQGTQNPDLIYINPSMSSVSSVQSALGRLSWSSGSGIFSGNSSISNWRTDMGAEYNTPHESRRRSVVITRGAARLLSQQEKATKFTCPECDDYYRENRKRRPPKFSRPRDQKRHETSQLHANAVKALGRIHPNAIEHKCDQCPGKFNRRDNLTRHRQCVHDP